MAKNNDLLTVQEAALEKRVTTTRVRQWIASGRLTRVERYGRVLVKRPELLGLKAKPAGRPKKN